MKSAYELAMERFGDGVRQYSDEQKAQLADVDKVYDAKAAQARFAAEARLQKAAGDAEKRESVHQDLAVEIASIERRRGQKKTELRDGFDKGE